MGGRQGDIGEVVLGPEKGEDGADDVEEWQESQSKEEPSFHVLQVCPKTATRFMSVTPPWASFWAKTHRRAGSRGRTKPRRTTIVARAPML